MNWNEIEGKWEQFSGKVREKWGKLTDNDLTVIKGKRDQLVGKLRERYGYAQDQAEKEASEFAASCNCSSTGSNSSSNLKQTSSRI